MAIYIVIGTMGRGKTLFATLYAIEFNRLNPDSKIFANYHILKLTNFTYSPYMFLPLSELENALIICDDFYSMHNLKGFTLLIVNMSRKRSLDVILTAQYYTMIPKQLRTLANFVEVNLVEGDNLQVKIVDLQQKTTETYVENAISIAKSHFATREVVEFATETKIKEQILKFSKSIDDLDTNIALYTSNSSKHSRILKELSEKL